MTKIQKLERPVCLDFRWGVSRGRETYGYNICTLYADGVRVSSCDGGGYDMTGTSLGNYIASRFRDRLLRLKEKDMPEHCHWEYDRDANGDLIYPKGVKPGPNARAAGKTVIDGRSLYGLTYHDPNYDPGKAVIGKDCSDRTLGKEPSVGETVAEAESKGKSFGLERLQAVYSASSKFPTRRHRIPSIDGACGRSSVETIIKAIGLTMQWLPGSDKGRNRGGTYLLREATRAEHKQYKERNSR